MIGKKLGSAIGRRGVLGGALGLGAGAAIGSGRPYGVAPRPGGMMQAPPPISGYSGGPNGLQAPEAVRALWKRHADLQREYHDRPQIGGCDLDLVALRSVSLTWAMLQQRRRDRDRRSVMDALTEEVHSLLEAAQKGVGAMLGLKR
jgi:hypothetical protein